MDVRRWIFAVVLFAAGLLIGQAVERQASAADSNSARGSEGKVSVGGVLLKAEDPEGLRRWYEARFGSLESDSPHFQAGAPSFLLRVAHLDRILERLAAEGIRAEGDLREGGTGRLARITDPEGNRVELWEPSG